jgi:hypothetical protein
MTLSNIIAAINSVGLLIVLALFLFIGPGVL